jgi:hypothetical protein
MMNRPRIPTANSEEFRAFLNRRLPPEDWAALTACCPGDLRSYFAFCETGAVTTGLQQDDWWNALTPEQRELVGRACDLLQHHADGRILNSIRVFCCL